MIQTEDNLVPRHLPFSDDPRGVEQHQAAHGAYDQVAIVRILAVHLTGSGRQRVLQGPKAMLNPAAPLPRPYKPQPADGGFATDHVALLLLGRIDHDARHRVIRRTGGPQPCIAHTGDLRAVTPEPLAMILQVLALDLPPIR